MVQQLSGIQGLMEKTKALGLGVNEPDAVRAAAAEFILEGPLRASQDQPQRGARIRGRREKNASSRKGKPERPNMRRQFN